jgi:hypothetical protein
MKNCLFCNNLIQDAAKFCPKCGANVQSHNLDSKATDESSPIGGSDSARSTPPPPPSRSAPGSIYSQSADSGSNQNNDSINYQSKSSHSKSKNNGDVGKILLKLITISIVIIFVFVIVSVLSDLDNAADGNQPQAEAPLSSDSNIENPKSESDSSYNAAQEQITAIQAGETRKAAEEESISNSEKPKSESDSSYNAEQERIMAIQAEETRKAAELELAKAKEPVAEAERALIEDRRKAADELAAQELSGTRASATCPYSKANPLLCESRARQQVSCAWDYAACGEPSFQKTISKTGCTTKVKTDRQNNQIILDFMEKHIHIRTVGCRAQIVPQDN